MPNSTSADRVRDAIERTVRNEWGRVLATLVADFGALDLAEDSLQDALVAALRRWPNAGIPESPRAWLIVTARRRAIDRVRRDQSFAKKRAELELLANPGHDGGDFGVDIAIRDERLRLIFTCCHPALSAAAQIALTLRTLCGLRTTEIARAFLVPETTMAQRIVRAKRKIGAANIPYRIPPPELWKERLDSVLAVLYLIFNEGYEATSGEDLTRSRLCKEAIRLGRLVIELIPDEPEANGLLALMLLHDARRPAREDAAGNVISLEMQDRDLWSQSQIAEGNLELARAARAVGNGPYRIQAAISAMHSNAKNFAATDWQGIGRLYRQLYDITASPVVLVNAAVAQAMDGDVAVSLEMLELAAKSGTLNEYQPYHAARADMLRRLGRTDAAIRAYNNAISLSRNEAEIRFLRQRLSELR